MKNIFKSAYLRPFLNPFIWMDIRSLGEYRGINDIKRETPVIVSLTAGNEDFEDLPITLYSILTQSMCPDEIVLWVSDKYGNLSELPYEITQFVKNGLTIRFVKDLGQYNTVYAFKEYKNSVIVTAKANFYYEKDWLKRLYTSYIINQKDIQVHMAKCVTSKNKILPIDKWGFVWEESVSYSNCMISAGGILYPPNCFSLEVSREDIFMKYIPKGSDFWLWVMSLVHNRKIRVVKNRYPSLKCFSFRKWCGQTNISSDDNTGANNILKLYSQNVYPKLCLK